MTGERRVKIMMIKERYEAAKEAYRAIGVDTDAALEALAKIFMDFAFFAIAFNIKKMCAKMAKEGMD